MKPVTFTEDGARRVIAATKAVEAGSRDMPSIRFRDAGGDPEPVRLCKTSVAWAKGTTAALPLWENGTPPNETQTPSATLSPCVNKFGDVSAGKWVILARGPNEYWYLIAAEC